MKKTYFNNDKALNDPTPSIILHLLTFQMSNLNK